MAIDTIKWHRGCVKIIDQTLLPNKYVVLNCKTVPDLFKAIKRLSVRGAPALGVAGAFGCLLGLKSFKGKTREAFNKHMVKTCDYLASSRPTAVNLFHSLNQIKDLLVQYPNDSIDRVSKRITRTANKIYQEDRRVCRAMGDVGSRLIRNKSNIMTVCNAGALATVDYGTALGVMYSAKKNGKKFNVYACETRPLLQGARLTTWELMQAKIPTTLICDSMAATLMKDGQIDAIFTGADRIAANGDAANKIGTYSLAILAHHHKVPFYVVAPFSTFDLQTKTGKGIPIEQRDGSEVTKFRDVFTAPKNVGVYNPAFDVTPNKYITAIVTEYGLIKPVNRKNVLKRFDQ